MRWLRARNPETPTALEKCDLRRLSTIAYRPGPRRVAAPRPHVTALRGPLSGAGRMWPDLPLALYGRTLGEAHRHIRHPTQAPAGAREQPVHGQRPTPENDQGYGRCEIVQVELVAGASAPRH